MTRTKFKNTAILIFTRTAIDEARLKKFDQNLGRKSNEQIADQLIRHTLQTARKSNILFHVLYSDQQTGKSFGERFTNAIADMMAKGHEKVIVIGTDAPQLTCDVLRKAANSLQHHGLILGPDLRGGTYLIGISKKYFSEETFLHFPWQSERLLWEMLRWANEQNIPSNLLSPLRDINYASDLQQVIRFIPA